jgi:serine/threonine protein kinase
MKEFNESVDNFSIGIIMYYMLCGNLPFDAVLQEEVNRLTVECNISLDNAHWSNVSDNVI